jgi:hypothetical protein
MKVISVRTLLASALIFFFYLSLSGCGSINYLTNNKKAYSAYGVDVLRIKGDSADMGEAAMLMSEIQEIYDPEKLCINANYPPQEKVKNSDKSQTTAASSANGQNATICTAKRQVIIGDLMGISNSMCRDHIKGIWGNEAGFNIAAGTFTNIFSGAATVVGATDGKSILSSLALFSNAERSLGNEVVYKNSLISSVVTKIVQSRNEKSNAIFQKIYGNTAIPYDQYPISLAVNDVLSYHDSCSFMNGLLRAINEGSSDKRVEKINELKNSLNMLRLELNQPINDQKVKESMQQRYVALSNTLQALQANADGTKHLE